MSKKRFLVKGDFPNLNDLLKGWNTFDIPKSNNKPNHCISVFNRLIAKDKWNIKDIKEIKVLCNDGCRPALDVIFLVWNDHPCYKKYIGTTVTPPPDFAVNEVQSAIKEGKDISKYLSPNDVVKYPSLTGK